MVATIPAKLPAIKFSISLKFLLSFLDNKNLFVYSNTTNLTPLYGTTLNHVAYKPLNILKNPYFFLTYIRL